MRVLISTLFAKKCEFCKKSGFRICPNCLSRFAVPRKSQDNVSYFLSYQDEKIRKLIWRFKYKNETIIAKDLAPLIGDFIYEQIENDLSLQNKPIYIVPAPITNDPTRYRLQNHMLIMAKYVQKYLHCMNMVVHICDCLQKTGTKRSAMIFGKKKRSANIEKVLVLKSPPPSKGIVFIIDDVTTTGATMKKISSLIKSKSPKNQVIAQTVALAH